MQLDFRHLKHWTMQRCPDILLLPSRLTPLVKEVPVQAVEFPNGNESYADGVNVNSNVLVVNPGPLVKGRAGGSYADINIHPMPESHLREAILQSSSPILHNVPARTFAQIIKI